MGLEINHIKKSNLDMHRHKGEKSAIENMDVQIYVCSDSRNWKMEYGYFMNLEEYRSYLMGERKTHQEPGNLISLERNEAQLIKWWYRCKSI